MPTFQVNSFANNRPGFFNSFADLQGASALPTTQGPFLAVVVPNVGTPVFVPGAIFGKTINNVTLTSNLYRRVEFQFLDFQMNQTTPFTDTLVQPIDIYANVT